MSKLQLYITISLKGYRNQAEFNANENVRQHVSDVSAALEVVKYNAKEKNILYLLKYTDEGVFVTVLRTIPSKHTDHLASWIFIPSDIRISNEEIEDVVKSVVEVVSQSKITSEGFNLLRSVFDHEYPTLDNAGATISNYGNQYAHRFFGANSGYSLADYIGIHRYQTEYLKYAGVILADKTRVESISGPDLTAMPIEQMVNIFPPLPGDRGYRPLIFGRHPFTRPYLVPLMQPLEIVWECSGAVDIRQSIMVSKPNMRPDNISTTPRQSSAARTKSEPQDISKDTPESAADLGTPDDNATPDKTSATQPNPALKQRNEPRFDRRPEKKAAVIDRLHVYNFEIPAKSADIAGMIHFEIQTRAVLEGSPIDGYELSDTLQEGATRSNHLIYSPNVTVLKTTAWGVAGLVAGIILTLVCISSFGEKGSKSANTQFTDETDTDTTLIIQNPGDIDNIQPNNAVGALVQDLISDASLDKAVTYLDSNDNWDKTSLESYPDLRGLYDDMNTMNRDRIVNHWGPKLKDSRKFNKIVEHTKKSLKAHKKTRIKSNGKFNPDSKTTISVRSWLNAVDP